MKKYIKQILFYIIALTFLFTASSCVHEERHPVACAIVVGHHNNSFRIDTDTLIRSIAKEVYTQSGNICIVECDGTPSVVYDKEGTMIGRLSDDIRSKIKDGYFQSKKYWDHKIDIYIDNLVEEINAIEPDDSEFNTLNAIQVASEAVDQMASTMGQNVIKKIVVCDTGLSTCGKLNFSDDTNCRLVNYDGDISTDAKMQEKVNDLVMDLTNNKELNGLNKIMVEWYGLGKVADPQPELSKLCSSNLQYIWEEVFKAANVLSSDKDSYNSIFRSSPTDESFSFDLNVSVIKHDTLNDIDVVKIEGFIAGKDLLYSEGTAFDILTTYCNDILDYYPNMEILIVGSTASIDAGSVDLADKRAVRIKDMLVSIGIDSNRIKTIGLGANTPWHTDENKNGMIDENLAQKNRAVYILPFESELAQRLYSGNY